MRDRLGHGASGIVRGGSCRRPGTAILVASAPEDFDSTGNHTEPRAHIMSRFRVGITRDFLKPDGTIGFGDIGLSLLDADPGIEWEFLKKDVSEITSRQANAYDALLVLGPRVSAASLDDVNRLALVA